MKEGDEEGSKRVRSPFDECETPNLSQICGPLYDHMARVPPFATVSLSDGPWFSSISSEHPLFPNLKDTVALDVKKFSGIEKADDLVFKLSEERKVECMRLQPKDMSPYFIVWVIDNTDASEGRYGSKDATYKIPKSEFQLVWGQLLKLSKKTKYPMTCSVTGVSYCEKDSALDVIAHLNIPDVPLKHFLFMRLIEYHKMLERPFDKHDFYW
jgi:hypothetical protein